MRVQQYGASINYKHARIIVKPSEEFLVINPTMFTLDLKSPTATKQLSVSLLLALETHRLFCTLSDSVLPDLQEFMHGALEMKVHIFNRLPIHSHSPLGD